MMEAGKRSNDPASPQRDYRPFSYLCGGIVAGDWIKLEYSTLDKPEILRLARLWGIDKNASLGVCIRFWIWLDSATVDGVVDGIASHELDDLMRFPGFTTAMIQVGWLKVDDVNLRISVPNFTNHNGESSKKRALKTRRQARWREGNVDAVVDAQASPEKRREEVTSASDLK